MSFTKFEQRAAKKLIKMAFEEDLGGSGGYDCTSAMLPVDLAGRAAYVARSRGVLAGQPVVEMIYRDNPRPGDPATYEPLVADGTRLEPGTVIGRVAGPMRAILECERVTLNFLQRLSGIASFAQQAVDRVAGLPCRILDTRKTTPGWRLLEKYAVRCGGGTNHRMGLYDGVLFKDNHLAAFAQARPPMTLADAVNFARRAYHGRIPSEVEVDTLEQLDEALACRPDIILLDNMDSDRLRESVRRRNAVAPEVQLEASGGITLDTVRSVAETGVDRISIGALTHSAPALDIALDYLPA